MDAPQALVAVALSGGRDSMALLHATVRACGPLGVEVIALHVHHGLLPEAQAWLAHCEAHCAERAARGEPLRFAACRLGGRPGRGESVEAWAREARYAALSKLAREHGSGLVLLAHHRRDQAETFLLQALRGAGAAGLAAMPRTAERDGVVFARPWLDRPREAIEAYARRFGLCWVDDRSNADPRFARSRLRVQVWTVLESAFPQAETALAAAARRSADAAALCDEDAEVDLHDVAEEGGPIVVRRWLALSPARRANVLRAWLRRADGGLARASLIERLLDELPAARSARWPAGNGTLQLHRGRLALVDGVVSLACDEKPAVALRIRRAGRRRLPGWGGCLLLRRVTTGGVALARLADAEARSRQGGERFQAGAARPPRSLKKQYQSTGVAEWERSGPLVWQGGELLFVPGLGIDQRALARAGEPQVDLRWVPDRLLRRSR